MAAGSGTGRPKASLVCELFSYNENSDLSVCKAKDSEVECGKGIKGKNPTNLKQHLSKYHPNDYKKCLEKERIRKEDKEKSKSLRQEPSQPTSSNFNAKMF